MATSALKVGVIFVTLVLVVQSNAQFWNSRSSWNSNRNFQKSNPWDSIVKNVKKAVNNAQDYFNVNFKNLFGDLSSIATRIQGFKVLPDGSIQLTFHSGAYNQQTLKIIFDFIIKILRQFAASSPQVTLGNGETVTWNYVISVLQKVFILQRESQLTDKDKQVLSLVWNQIQKSGFRIVGISSEGGNDADSWKNLWLVFHPQGGSRTSGASLKGPGGQPVTFELLWNYLSRDLRGRAYVRLPSGSIVTSRYLLSLLQSKFNGKGRKGAVTYLEKTAWQYIWTLLRQNGFVIEGANPNGSELELILNEVSEQTANAEPEITTQDGNKVDLKFIGSILLKSFGGKRSVKINGRNIQVNYILRLLSDSGKGKPLNEQDINIWTYLWSILQKEGIKIGNGGSWTNFRNFLLKLNSDNSSKDFWKSLNIELKRPQFQLPQMDYGQILKNLFSFSFGSFNPFSGRGFNPFSGGKFNFNFQTSGLRPQTVNSVWKFIIGIFGTLAKNNEKINLGNGIELTSQQVLSILQQSLRVSNPRLLSAQYKLVWEYVWSLLLKGGFNLNVPGKSQNDLSWVYLWNILRQQPNLSVVLRQLPDFNNLFNFNVPKTPQFQLPGFKLPQFQLPGFNLPQLPNVSNVWKNLFGSLKGLSGLKVLPNGKIQFSWNRGNFNADSITAIWKILINLIGRVNAATASSVIDIGNGIQLTSQQLLSILIDSLRYANPSEISAQAKLAWDYVWKLLQNTGFSIVGIGGQSWEILFQLLRRVPAPKLPGFNFNLPSFNFPNIDFSSVWNNVIGSGISIPGIRFLPGGKFQFSWQGGRFSLDAVNGIWKLLTGFLLQIQRESSNNLIDIGSGINLTAQQILLILQNSLKVRNPNQLDATSKAVWDFIWSFLHKSGFSVGGLRGRQSWIVLWNILRKQPTLPDLSFLKLPSYELPSFKIPKLDFSGFFDSLRFTPGFKLLPGGRIQFSWGGGNFNLPAVYGIWKLILGGLQDAQKQGVNNLIEIGNGLKLTAGQIWSILFQSINVQSPQQLSEEVKAVWNYIWNLLLNNGFSIEGLPKLGEGQEPWEFLWNVFHSQINLPGFKLPSLPEFHVNLPTFKWPATGFPKLHFDAIWNSLIPKGEIIAGLNFLPDGKVKFSWQGGDFNPSSVDFVWKFVLESLQILSKKSEGNLIDLGNGIKLTWKVIEDTIKNTAGLSSPDQLSPTDKAVWEFVAALLLKGGFDIADLPELTANVPFWTFVWNILHRQPEAPAIKPVDENEFVGLLPEEISTTAEEPPGIDYDNKEPTTPTYLDLDYGDDYDYGGENGDTGVDSDNDNENGNDGDNTGDQGKENEISDADKERLQNVLQILQTNGDSATGTVEFQDNSIPISFIITFARLKHYDLKTITLEELIEIVKTYVGKAEESSKSVPNSDLTKDKEITLSIILDDLKDNVDSSEPIEFDGQEIPREFVVNVLKAQNIDLESVTPNVLYRIFLLYISSKTNEKPKVASNIKGALETLRSFLIKNGDRASGSLLVNNHPVSVEKVLATLKLQNIRTQDVTIDDLWRILQLIISTQEVSSVTTDQKTFTFNYFVKLLKDPKNVPYSKMVVDGHEISLLDILKALGVQKDPETGIYPIDDITKDELWTILQSYVSQSSSDTQESKEKFRVFEYFLKVISDPNSVPNGYLIVNYNGQKTEIKLEDVISELDLQKDPDTGKYIVDDVTPDTLWTIVQNFLGGGGNGGSAESKESTLEYFISLISDPSNVPNGVLVVSDGSGTEKEIKLQEVVDGLKLQIDPSTGKYDVSGLTADDLWDFLSKYF